MTRWPDIEDDIDAWLAMRPRGHFTIGRANGSWTITVHSAGCPVETIVAKSPGEVNRLRQKLSDKGLCGYAEDAS